MNSEKHKPVPGWDRLRSWRTLGILIVLVGAGCSRSDPTSPGQISKESAAAATDAVLVTVAGATNAAWDRVVSSIGTLFPKDEATVAAQVDGLVERTRVEFGDRVEEGQELALIDTASYQAQLEKSAGELARSAAMRTNAEQNFVRIQSLVQDRIASRSDFDQARAQLDQAEADVKAFQGAQMVSRLNVQRSQVQAPFTGAIAMRYVNRGDYAHAGSPLFSIVNDAVLKFIFAVPERYGSAVTKRLPVEFSVDNYPGETFGGTVYLISPSVNSSSRAFNVGALVTNTNFRLKANTFARGSLILERGVPTLVVPLEAVNSFAGVTKVFVIRENRADSKVVELGRIRSGLQEIVSGLTVGEIVVVTGQRRLTDGARVRVQAMTGKSEAAL